MMEQEYSQTGMCLQYEALGTALVQQNKAIPRGYHTQSEKATKEIAFLPVL